MTGGATRRSVLAAALAAAPVAMPVLASAGCGASAAATAPARGPSDVAILTAAIAAKESLVNRYTAVLASYPSLAPLLGPLLGDNDAHLSELRQRLIEPVPPPTHSAPPRPPPPVPGTTAAALSALASAEQAAAAAHVGQLRRTAPSLAQLLASIAACEATHVAALSPRGLTP